MRVDDFEFRAGEMDESNLKFRPGILIILIV